MSGERKTPTNDREEKIQRSRAAENAKDFLKRYGKLQGPGIYLFPVYCIFYYFSPTCTV